MRIDKSLNLVCHAESENGDIHFHSMPILRDTFKKYSLVLCKTFNELLQNGLIVMGARIAANHLEEVAVSLNRWEGKEGVKDGLMKEIERLTNVLVLTEKGWEALPVDLALSRDYVSEEDWEEAKQKIVFFTLIYVMATLEARREFFDGMNSTWGTETTSADCMEYIRSLPTLTATEITSRTENQSSVPVQIISAARALRSF